MLLFYVRILATIILAIVITLVINEMFAVRAFNLVNIKKTDV